MRRVGNVAEPAAEGRRFRRVLRTALILALCAASIGALPAPHALADGLRKVGVLDRHSGLDSIPANGNILIDSAARRGYQAASTDGTMYLYEVDLDTLKSDRRAEIPELMTATTSSGPTEWLWTLDAAHHRIYAIARTVDPTLRIEAYSLETIDLRTLKGTTGDILWAGGQRLPLAISYHAPSDRLYVMTRAVAELAGRSRFFAEERTAAGERTWEYTLNSCYNAIDNSFPPVVARSVLRPSNLYLNCYNSGTVQAQIVRLTLAASGPVREESFAGVPGPLSALFDYGSDRMLFLTINGGAGRGAWVFDGLQSSFLGVIASGDARVGASDYAMGLDPSNGRLYMQTPAGFLVADSRRTPLPSGLLFRSMAGRTTGMVHVDPRNHWVFVPDPNFKNDQGQSLRYEVLEDTIRVSRDPARANPDALTADVAERKGVTDVNFAGGARAFALRTLTTGGVQRAAWNIAIGSISPEEQTSGQVYQALLQAPLDQANRDLYAARVRGASLSNQSSDASASFADSDAGTVRDLNRAGQAWPVKPAECTDDGGKDGSNSTTAAAASCSMKAASSNASSSLSGSASEEGAAISSRTLLAFGSVQKAGSLGLLARSIAIVRDLSLANRVKIGEIRAEATTAARGRRGSASATFERSISGVRADTDGDGTYDFSCEQCDPRAVKAAIERAFAGQLAVEFPEPDPLSFGKGSPGGYQALVQKDTFRSFAERSLNEDDSPEVPAMQLIYYADARAGRTRQIVQIAGVQAESHYGIYLLGDPGSCCASPPTAPPPPDVPVVKPPAPQPTIISDPGPPPAPKTVTESFLRRTAAGTAIAMVKPRDALALAALWLFLLLPAYLGVAPALRGNGVTMKRKIVKALPVILAVTLLSTVSFATRFVNKTEQRTRTVDAAGNTLSESGGSAGTGAGTDSSGGGSSVSKNGVTTSGSSLACDRAHNGGATDTGVSRSSIKLGATVVKSGIGASFLKEVPIALQAQVNKVNRNGGVCGRLLSLRMVDDGWRADRGEQFIRNFISEGVFALAVSPSSEGLDAAIRNGDIRRAGIPVVGADGMLISQYTEPWVWPVAASTITTMHVMARDAASRGAKTFGLVFDKSYHFGVEGASALRGALKRIGSQLTLKADVGIEAGQANYKNDVNTFNGACNPCDFVAMLLEPTTALQWIRDGASFGSMPVGGTGGPQPLFTDAFARPCGQPCNGMWVWTGYTPPIPPFDDLPAVAQYVNDVHAQSATIDVNNPFVEGGYLGMELLLKALHAVGPNLTRAGLRASLDQTLLDDGLTVPLRWHGGNHFANAAVQAFSIVMNNGSFEKWRSEQTGWIHDPWIGLDGK